MITTTFPPSSGGTGSTYINVNTYADLPDPTTVSGQIYVVLSTTGIIFINRKLAGFYLSTGASWAYLGDTVDYHSVPTGGTSGQILKKNSDTNFDVGWQSLPAKSIKNSGNWYAFTAIKDSGTILTANRIYYVPFYATSDITIDAIGGRTFTTAVDSMGVFGIYDSNPTTGYPKSLLVQTAPVSTPLANTVYTASLPDISLEYGKLYYTAVTFNVAAQWQISSISDQSVFASVCGISGSKYASMYPVVSFYETYTYNGSLPANATINDSNATGNSYTFFMRAK